MYKFFYIPGVAGSTLSSCHLLIASVMNYFFPKPLKYSSFSDYTTFLATNQNGRSPRKSPELRVVRDIYMISVYLAVNLPVFFQKLYPDISQQTRMGPIQIHQGKGKVAWKLAGNSPVPNKTPSFGPVTSARGLAEVPNRPPAQVVHQCQELCFTEVPVVRKQETSKTTNNKEHVQKSE